MPIPEPISMATGRNFSNWLGLSHMPIAEAWGDITTTQPAWIDSQGETILLRKTEVILPKRVKGCEVRNTIDDYYIFVK